MSTTNEAPHGRGMAWATLLVSAGISLGVNLWHAFDQAHGHVTWWFAALAVMYGTAPVVLAAFQAHSAAFVAMGWFRLTLTYVLMLLGMALSIRAQAAAVEPFAGNGWRWVFPIVVDLSAIMALITLMITARTKAEAEAMPDVPERTAQPRLRHVICVGSSDGTLFLARPTRKKNKPVPVDLGVSAGQRVHDLATVLGGHHSPIVYFLANGDRVKIGTTTHLRPRIRRLALRVDNLALVLAGDATLEAELHARFAAYRDGNTEWFELTGEVKAFIDAGGQASGASSSAVAVDTSGRQETTSVAGSGEVVAPVGGSGSTVLAASGAVVGGGSGDSGTVESAPVPRQRQPRSGGAKSRSGASQKRTRRSMTEWVELAGPLFHEEMDRLHRQPTGDEFAEAIARAGLGSVSPSTAKNIRTEILDRAPVPALDDLTN